MIMIIIHIYKRKINIHAAGIIIVKDQGSRYLDGKQFANVHAWWSRHILRSGLV